MANKKFNAKVAVSAIVSLFAASTALALQPEPAAPVAAVAAPSAPAQVAPASVAIMPAPAAGAPSRAGFQLGKEDDVEPVLRQIYKKKAELELKKIEGDLLKAEQPLREDREKAAAREMQHQLESIRGEQKHVAEAKHAVNVHLLSTYGMGDKMFAELKVGDQVVIATTGQRLPSGQYLRGISSSSVDLAPNMKSKKFDTVFLSATDAASVYAAKGREGGPAGPGLPTGMPSGAPGFPGTPNFSGAGLPPLPGMGR